VSFEAAFLELRPAMLALAYRITGSSADAEEVVQEAFLKLPQGDALAAIRSRKAFLTTVTARLSLNRLRAQRARRELYVGEWLPEPLPTARAPGADLEDLSFALMVLLERLNPRERVVFLLRTAFDYEFEEIAPIVERDAAHCRKLFSRARAQVLAAPPRFAVDRARHRALMRSFLEAVRGADLGRTVALLAEEAVLHGDGGGLATGTKKPVVGALAVARFVIAVARSLGHADAVEEMELNGAPALVLLREGLPLVAVLIESDGAQIQRIFAIANPEKLARLKSA